MVMSNNKFPLYQFGRIEVRLISKSQRFMELSVPSEMVVCPNCLGRSVQHDCGLCAGANVIEVVSETFLKAYPLIDQAMLRYDRIEQADAYDRESERALGC